jgi:glycosyltransferase involved in cell wall biosynthesis
MKIAQQKVAVIIQPYVPKYRVPLFEEMQKLLAIQGVTLTIMYGSQLKDRQGVNDGIEFAGGRKLRQLYLGFQAKGLVFRLAPLRAFTCDLLILEQATKNLESYLLFTIRRVLRKRTCLWGHGYTITKRQSKLQLRLQAWMMVRSHWLFAYTESSASRGIAIGADSRRLTVLNNSIDSTGLRLALDSCEHPRRQNTWNALYIGALTPDKKIDVLLEIAEKVYSEDARFRLLIGGSGPSEHLLYNPRLGAFVKYLGHLDENGKAKAAAQSEVLLMPGRVGLISVDAFALRLPILTLASSQHAPEFEYLNESNSVIVDSPDDLARELRKLMLDNDRILSLKRGSSLSMEGLTIQEMANRFATGIGEAIQLNVRSGETTND